MTEIVQKLLELIVDRIKSLLVHLSVSTIAPTFALVWFVVLALLHFVVSSHGYRVDWRVWIIAWALLTILSTWFEPYGYYFVWLPLWYRIDNSASFIKHPLQKILFLVDWTEEANAMRRRIYFSIPRVLKESSLPEHKKAWKEFFDTPDEYGETRWQKLSDAEQRYPMIARAIDVFGRKDFLEKAKRVFAILLIDDKDISFRYDEKRRKGRQINVKLLSKLWKGMAIYSNLGKAWLNFQMRKKFDFGILLDKANWVHSWLIDPNSVDSYYPTEPLIDLRWASGGGISFVRIADEKWSEDPLDQVWVALFFRDIPPVGWNVGNGGSETREELIKLDEELCWREFVEEYMVIEERNAPGDSCKMAIFEQQQNGHAKKKTSEPFVRKHDEYRKRVDGLALTPGKITIEFEFVKGAGTSIWIWPSEEEEEAEKNYHLLFSLNPFEQGIETIGLYFWTLPKGYTIIDGEFHLGRKVLIRRPVGLFNLGWLYQYWKNNKSLGNVFDPSVHGVKESFKKKFAECKILEEVPAGKFRLMAKDFDLRKKRLQRLIKHNAEVFSKRIPQREAGILSRREELYHKTLAIIEQIKREGVESLDMWKLTQSLHSSQCTRGRLTPELAAFWLYRRYLKDAPYGNMTKPVVTSWEDVWFEIELSATWLCDYGRLIEELLHEKEPALTGMDTLPLRSLCPVTWKSLEMVFASEEIMSKIKELAQKGVA